MLGKLRYWEILFVLLLLFVKGFSQKKFFLTVQLDSSTDCHDVSCQYYNGLRNIRVKDTFSGNILTVKDVFVGERVTFSVTNMSNHEEFSRDDFFIGEKPAKITMHYYAKNGARNGNYTNLLNAMPIWDETLNPLYRELQKFRVKESTAVYELWRDHRREIGVNDSILQQNKVLSKELNRRTIAFLDKHSSAYFSFWFFKYQVVYPSIAMFKEDRDYFKELTAAFQGIFPEKFTKSAEGRALVKEMGIYADPPLKLGDITPVYEVKDIAGKAISLRNHKSRYLLLNFWQTWYGPCVQELRSLAELRESYGPDDLEIVSITDETDFEKVGKFIREHDMTWSNILDRNGNLRYLFRVNAYPSIILIDRRGTIRYLATGLAGNEGIRKIVEE